MINRQERLAAHSVRLPEGYVPVPQSHLGNARDRTHFQMAAAYLKAIEAKTVLDVGCYDGWLDFLLIGEGYSVEGVELIPDLARAARRYADRNFISYTVHEGYFADMDLDGAYDAVLCFETLEHMPLEEAKACAEKMSRLAKRGVIISLPNQKHEDNRQHLWTPSKDVIEDIWGRKPGYSLSFVPYPETNIPGNYFISHDGGK